MSEKHNPNNEFNTADLTDNTQDTLSTPLTANTYEEVLRVNQYLERSIRAIELDLNAMRQQFVQEDMQKEPE
jgi:hypothetical protein